MDTARLTIFVNQKFPDADANALLERSLAGHRVLFSRSVTTSNLAASAADPAIDDADVAFGQPDPAACAAAPKLKWLHLTSAGYDRYDRPDLRAALAARGAVVTNSSSVYEEPCAQHAVAMMLGLARQLTASYDNQRGARGWPANEIRKACRLLGPGQTLVILSYGAIAKRVVELLAPYRLNVIAVRRKPAGNEPVRTIAEADADSVLPLADHVLNILPGGPATRQFVSRDRLARLKPGCTFYNIGRGQTVDQPALIDALTSGQLAAAYLDVTDPEPLPPDHPLWRTANCFITPHTAGGHHDEFHRLVRHFVENVERFARGQPLKDRVI
jgi:phosphoglycerate dehydrogenase-like enzyme